MNKVARIIAVLTLTGILSGLLLVFVYNYAAPLIAANQERETKDGIFLVMPEGAVFKKLPGDKEMYTVADKDGKELGYVFTVQGNGYQGNIKIIAGVKDDLKTLTGIEILESQETPGLGQEITVDYFKDQFKGLKADPQVTYVKGRPAQKAGEIQAVTGATISSKAVVNIINEGLEQLKDAVRK